MSWIDKDFRFLLNQIQPNPSFQSRFHKHATDSYTPIQLQKVITEALLNKYYVAVGLMFHRMLDEQ
jgi:hypothetical protein